ncbi:MAG: TatD family hydrolase [Armatimonadetes bacterium]|nr:TatD family hydrolase [Armatimonadota bacterium]
MFDSHAHLNHQHFQADRAEVLLRAREAGLTGLVNVGWDVGSSRLAVALAQPEEGIYAAVGIHPHHAADASANDYAALVGLARRQEVVAIGETGLDFFRNLSPRDAQVEAFCRHIELAAEAGLPLIVHDREAHEEIFAILARHAPPGLRIVLHCYSAGPDLLDEAMARGYWIGLSCNVTYPKATGLREVARRVPAERLLLETDCPYLPPQSKRGRRNEPAFLRDALMTISAVRDCPVALVERQTETSARDFFGL